MRITRHCAADMRQALRAIREQLGPDAVILSSRRTAEGVEITAAMDFDADELRAAEALAKAADAHPQTPLSVPTVQAVPAPVAASITRAAANVQMSSHGAAGLRAIANAQIATHTQPVGAEHVNASQTQVGHLHATALPATPARILTGVALARANAQATVLAQSRQALPQNAAVLIGAQHTTTSAGRPQAIGQAVQTFAAQNAAPAIVPKEFAPQAFIAHAPRHDPAQYESVAHDDDSRFEHTGFPTAQPAEFLAGNDAPASPTDLMGNELKTLRRMLETQLAQLAWNDLSRRAPIHTEMLRELTELGLGQELAAQVVAQLPAHLDLTQARRLAIATLAQQVLVTGDRWLEDGGRVALVGPTGVGKTSTLSKLAVRWVLRHGPRDLAIVAGDNMRIGAQEQLNTLGQLLGARVYPLKDLAELPDLLSRLGNSRFVLIDTPGSSQRDAQLASRFDALNAVGPDLETALVLGASTQAGANAEVVQRFAAVSPASCVLTKVDEAASLGGLLSVLVRARLPISYMSEGQRVPEDLRPARSLELVSSAVQLAQSTGAAADEDLLRRRFGELAHAIA